jgi:transposase
MRLAFQKFWTTSPDQVRSVLKQWHFWATHSRLKPMIEFAHTLRQHEEGILRWATSRISNGVLMGLNSLIQAAKAKARGYRSTGNSLPWHTYWVESCSSDSNPLETARGRPG